VPYVILKTQLFLEFKLKEVKFGFLSVKPAARKRKIYPITNMVGLGKDIDIDFHDKNNLYLHHFGV
jgi:hypothetical protein